MSIQKFSSSLAMITLFFLMLAASMLVSAEGKSESAARDNACPNFLNESYRLLHHTKESNLCDLVNGDVVLIVNTASHCGYTPQFKGLEALNQKYSSLGLTTIGFASDAFNQETKDEAESAGICFKNFGVTFTMLASTQVRGEQANTTFQHLNSKTQAPSWNFNKYLVDLKTGEVKHFGSRTQPLNSDLEKAISELLGS